MAERVDYLAQSWTQNGEAAVLKGCRCSACGANFFPARVQCTECLAENSMEEMNLPEEGNLYTYTILQRTEKGFPAPMAVGYVDFAEQNVRVFGQLAVTEEEMDRLHTDMPVKVIAGVIKSLGDTETWGYRFKPVFGKEEESK